jgi:hypothetical protein
VDRHTNWTVTGLCTQMNNGILIEEAGLAAGYTPRVRSTVGKDGGMFHEE